MRGRENLGRNCIGPVADEYHRCSTAGRQGKYQRERAARPIIANQGISFKLADMAMAIDAARLLVWRAGWMAARGIPFERAEESMAKCFAGDVAVKLTLDAPDSGGLRLHAGLASGEAGP